MCQFFELLLVDWLNDCMVGVEKLRRAATPLGAGMAPPLLVTVCEDPQMLRGSSEANVSRVVLKPPLDQRFVTRLFAWCGEKEGGA